MLVKQLWDQTACRTVERLCGLGLDVAIAEGVDSEILSSLCDAPLYTVVVSRCITAQDNPASAVKAIKRKIPEVWPA
jgi:3-keto-L-gulonate-6-phosphate decarboxylase